eukprot:scaffold14591_cov140-Isochrysis_galbana.AAC.5
MMLSHTSPSSSSRSNAQTDRYTLTQPFRPAPLGVELEREHFNFKCTLCGRSSLVAPLFAPYLSTLTLC